jgi:hypothetical protein
MSILKLNPEMAIEIPEQDFLVQNFMAVLMAQRQDFYLLPFGIYLVNKYGKNWEIENSPRYITSFSLSIGQIKKN